MKCKKLRQMLRHVSVTLGRMGPGYLTLDCFSEKRKEAARMVTARYHFILATIRCPTCNGRGFMDDDNNPWGLGHLVCPMCNLIGRVFESPFAMTLFKEGPYGIHAKGLLSNAQVIPMWVKHKDVRGCPCEGCMTYRAEAEQRSD